MTSVLPENVPRGTEGMFHQQYLIGKKLGAGSFAHVYTAKQVSTEEVSADKVEKEEYAAKVMEMRRCINKVDPGTHALVAQEVAVLRRVGAMRLCVRLVDAFIDGSCAYIVMEKCECSLPERLERTKTLTEHKLVEVLRQMLAAICCIHSVSVVHRDIKPTNFLVKNGSLKLCDFGMADVLGPSNSTLVGNHGTAPYMSPEMLSGEAYDAMTDVWSIGVTAHVLLLGKFPYTSAARNSRGMKAAVLAGTPAPDFEPSGGLPQVSSFAKQCLRSVLIRNPKMRPSAMDTLAAFSKLAEETSIEPAQWSTTSLRPTIQEAKRIGAFSAPDLNAEPTNLDRHVRRLQAKYHGTSQATRGVGWWRGKGSRVAAADV